jgi:hypothetical protein
MTTRQQCNIANQPQRPTLLSQHTSPSHRSHLHWTPRLKKFDRRYEHLFLSGRSETIGLAFVAQTWFLGLISVLFRVAAQATPAHLPEQIGLANQMAPQIVN